MGIKLLVQVKGGKGSGNFGHAGIPGHLGGSAAGKVAITPHAQQLADNLEQQIQFFSAGETQYQRDTFATLTERRNRILSGEDKPEPLPELKPHKTRIPKAPTTKRSGGDPSKIDPGIARSALSRAGGDKQVAWTRYIQLHYQLTGNLAPEADSKDLVAFFQQHGA